MRRATPYTAVVERGETIVAPKGWWHYAVSLDTSAQSSELEPCRGIPFSWPSAKVTIMRNFYSTSNQWDLTPRCIACRNIIQPVSSVTCRNDSGSSARIVAWQVLLQHMQGAQVGRCFLTYRIQ